MQNLHGRGDDPGPLGRFTSSSLSEERLLRGTWCNPELRKTVDVWYRIVHIHEVWQLPEEQGQEGLFADYVNTWLELKQK